MKNKIIIFFLSLITALTVAMTVLPVVSFAQERQTPTQRCEAFKSQFNLSSGNPFAWVNPARYCTAQGFLYWLLQAAMVFAGVIAVLFVVIGGYWYMTAAGNEEQAEKGRKTLMNSIIGLVVIILSFVIIRVVINTVTGDVGSQGTNTTNNTNPSSDLNQNTTDTNVTVVGAINFSGPASAKINEAYYFSFTVPKDTADFYCKNVSTPTFVATVKDVNGKIQKIQSSSTGGNSGYTLSFGETPTSLGFVDKPGELSDKSLSIGLLICGQQAPGEWSVPITYSTSGIRGPSLDTSKVNAALASTFSASLINNNKTIVVSISANISDRLTLCDVSFSQLGTKKMEVFVDGKSAGSTTADSHTIDLNYNNPITTSKVIGVKICGYDIGAGSQTVMP